MRKSEIRKIKKRRREAGYVDIQATDRSDKGLGFNVYLWLIFLACGAIGMCASLIYLNTIIPFQNIALITCLGGIAGLILLYRVVHRYEPADWAAAFISLWCGCNLSCFAVLGLNRALAGKSINTETFPIVRSGISKGRNTHHTYAYIDFHGVSKDIRFGGTNIEVLSARAVRLTYAEGLLGYAIIRERQLK